MGERASSVENMVKNIFSGVYKGKKVLVTGHTGFKGSWLSLWLDILGAEVFGYSLYIPSSPSSYEAMNLGSRLSDHRGDVRNFENLLEKFRQVNPDIVFHLAAQPIVRKSYADPKDTFDTNVGGTVNVLECIRQTNSVRSAVIITSDKCYENVSWDYGYREIDRLGGADPYSASKACAEIACSAYIRSFFQKDQKKFVATARAGNVIGGGDWAENRIVPDCIRAWASKEKVNLRNPDSTRPWQHVLEPISGYLWLGSKLFCQDQNVRGESFNFGPTSEYSWTTKFLVQEMARVWGAGAWIHDPQDSFGHECSFLKLCVDKALSQLDWKPAFRIEEAIEKTVYWYQSYYQGHNIFDISQKQIRAYLEKAFEQELAWTGHQNR